MKNIEEYLSESELKKIAEKVAYENFYNQLSSEDHLKRIISNASFDMVSKLCDQHLPDDIEVTLSKNIEKIINELSAFTVFEKPSVWSKDSNVGWEILSNAIKENENLIKERVFNVINNKIDDTVLKEIKSDINDFIYETIQNKFNNS